MSSQAPAIDDQDIRPVVATGGSGNFGLYAFLAVLLVGGLALFGALSAHREALLAPRTTVPNSQAQIVAPPPLVLPPAPQPKPIALPNLKAKVAQPTLPPLTLPPPLPAHPAPLPQPAAQVPSSPKVIYQQAELSAVAPAEKSAGSGDRVLAGHLLHPSTTVPQGTVIPAVLETAIDSTQAGAVKALVQRDVYSFDGTKMLIGRGSQLYGTYKAGLNLGQKRVMITWNRLIRPDGVTINLDSPASDPLGQAGVKGHLHTHFLARFGGAILHSVLDIGVGLATARASNGYIVALPGSTQNLTQTTQPQVVPTLNVKQGTSVSVFVAKDLDFSSVTK